MPHQGNRPYNDASGKRVFPSSRLRTGSTGAPPRPTSGPGGGGLRPPGSRGPTRLTGGIPNPQGSNRQPAQISGTLGGGKPRAPHGGGQRNPSLSRRALVGLRKKQKRK